MVSFVYDRRAARQVVIWLSIIFSTIAGIYLAGIRVNTSGSVEQIFWVVNKPKYPLEIGQYVSICLPQEFVEKHELSKHFPHGGQCGGAETMLKRIIARPGDYMTVDENGVKIGDTYQNLSRPHPSLVRIEPGTVKIPPRMVAVMGDTIDSLDSRYFGAIKVSWITNAARPLF